MKAIRNTLSIILIILLPAVIIYFVIKKLQESKVYYSHEPFRILNEDGVEEEERIIEKSENKLRSDLNRRQKKVLEIIKSSQEADMEDIAHAVKNVHVRTLRRDLNKLADSGFIKKIGSTKAAKYILNV
ncbi:MAG TPA: DeoR family transcriptional regulator [Candidatus Dojkabacteria bacterium]|jgi:predicted HTH transcriptional regulator